MDFSLSEEQQAIFDMASGFAADRIAPHARDWEAEGTIPKELWQDVGELGFGGLNVSEEAGGAGLTRLDSTLVFEASFIYLFCICPIAGGLIVSLTLSLGSTRLLEVGDQS